MVTITIGKFNKREMFIPFLLEFNYTFSKHNINGLNFTLLSFTFVPNPFWNDLQNINVNCVPLSGMMDNRIQWRHTIPSMKIFA